MVLPWLEKKKKAFYIKYLQKKYFEASGEMITSCAIISKMLQVNV